MYVTSPSLEEAEKIAAILVEERLAACVNIYPNCRSIYKWDGQICKETEAILIIKTLSKLVSRLMERLQSLHSYECPAMISFKPDEVNQVFEAWIDRELN